MMRPARAVAALGWQEPRRAMITSRLIQIVTVVLTLACLTVPVAATAAPDTWSVSSPSGALALTLRVTAGGSLEYKVDLSTAAGPKTWPRAWPTSTSR